MQAQQCAHSEAAGQLVRLCQPDAAQPDFAGIAGLPLISFTALLLEVQLSTRLFHRTHLIFCTKHAFPSIGFTALPLEVTLSDCHLKLHLDRKPYHHASDIEMGVLGVAGSPLISFAALLLEVRSGLCSFAVVADLPTNVCSCRLVG